MMGPVSVQSGHVLCSLQQFKDEHLVMILGYFVISP